MSNQSHPPTIASSFDRPQLLRPAACRVLFLSLLALGIGITNSLRAQSQTASTNSGSRVSYEVYEVLSLKPEEVIVRIAPQYVTHVVREFSSGKNYTEMSIAGGSVMDSSGAPETPKIVLNFLAPDREPASIEIISQSLEVLPNIDLAPVPTYIKNDGDYSKQYLLRPERYYASPSPALFSCEAAEIFRTAYTERVIVSPVQYDAASRSVTRVRSLTLRIRFSHAAGIAPATTATSLTERDLYRGMFINGGESSFYHVAMPTNVSRVTPNHSALGSAGSGTWLQLTTTDEGVYRITAQDLANNGISGPIDPNSIELFGIGGELLSEAVTPTNGEWIERPIEVRTNGSALSELYFYARGTTIWKYSHTSGIDGLYHRLNPYSSTGHFLLKVGGETLGQHLRVVAQPDSLIATPSAPSNRVLTAVTHEVDRVMELGNIGREMLDQGIPREDVGPLTFDLPVPGYTGDSTTLRAGCDVGIQSTSDNPNTGHVTVQVNGQQIGTINSPVGDKGDLYRSWNNALPVAPSIASTPSLNVGLTFTSTSVTASAMLDFVELMYKRSTDLSSGTIPFMLIDRTDAVQYNFANASGGEVWDATNSFAPRIVANATGNIMLATLQADSLVMRRFIAFTPQTAGTPGISAIGVPSLRTTVGEKGATEIIIAPQDFLAQANELKALREQGGQATEPLSVAVVNVEDIYREFGYGSRDVTAIRDFMAYTFRHTANTPGATTPIYLLLLGGGHCDYQNRETGVPNYLPPWESPETESLYSFRQNVLPEAYPDDSYFGRVTYPADPSGQKIDVAVGRVSASSADTAESFVQKMREYEHASDTGAWRSLTSFVADDRIAGDPTDPNDLNHFGETEGEVRQLPERILVHKIYEVSYPTVYTAAGRRKPECEKAIIAAMNNGNVLLSFIGHGNPSVWTHEAILSVPATINRFNNFSRLTYVTTSTCDFSVYDNFAELSGGEQFLLKPDGGAIGLLGTSRSVTEESQLIQSFYYTLFNVDPREAYGTTSVGTAFLAGKKACTSANLPFFYLLGDPAQRLLVPKLTVNFDSIQGVPDTGARIMLPALSQVRVSGSVGQGAGANVAADATFNGTVTVTLYDTPTQQEYVTVFPTTKIDDKYMVEGPVLYRGTATVINGRFSLSFIVPKDVKLDSASAKLSGYAYSSDTRTALGDSRNLQLVGSDSAQSIVDTVGPSISLWIGSRAFQSGEAVSKHSTAIADIADLHGLNTSTSSIGHSFIAWVDDAQESAVDMASTFVSKPNDYTSGTSERAIELPAGHHTLHVRAFDTFDNPSFASVEFVAKNEAPYELYNVTNSPNPVLDHTMFSFVQPGQAGSLVNISLALFTTDGRRVRTLTAETRESVIDLLWDGRDDAGNTVANGVYMFTVNAHDLDDGTSSLASGKCIVKR